MTKKDIKIEKAIQVHGDKYDYSEWPNNVKYLDKVPITCKEHNIRFIQSVKSHLRGSSGCYKCTIINVPKTREERIQQLIDVHGNKYDYSELPYSTISLKTKVKIKCIKHNVYFNQIFRRHLFGRVGCKKCIDEKRTQTNIERFGHKCALNNEVVKNKAIKTNLEKYGVENVFQCDDVKNKIKQTNLKKYGVENPSSSNEIKEKKKQKSIDAFGVSNHLQHDSIKEKIKQTNLKKYGVEFATQKHISKKTWDVLNDKEQLYEQHIIQQKSLLQISKELGDVGDSMVGRRLHNHGIKTMNHCQSQPEREIGDFLDNIGVSIETNIRDLIPPYEIDIYISEHKLAIEYCGLFWHSEQAGKHKNYHKIKRDLCDSIGVRLLTIFEDEWGYRKEQVKSKILSMLGMDIRERIYARKTNIEVISKKQKAEFFEVNHIQGDGPSSINIGLFYNEELVACMGFIRMNSEYYLNRYATSAHVIGGFSKLLKYFKMNYDWNTIVSFADLRWSDGNLYKTTGWVLDAELQPDYSYVPPMSNKRHHKFNYRHKHLATKLENYNSELTERENCDNNGILCIWDCGKQRWVINS